MRHAFGRNLALYAPVLLCAYALVAGGVHTLTGAEPRMSFVTAVGVSALVAWWVTVVFLPAALVLLGLGALLPARWPRAARRATLLSAAPPLFGGSMGAAALATSVGAHTSGWANMLNLWSHTSPRSARSSQPR